MNLSRDRLILEAKKRLNMREENGRQKEVVAYERKGR
jgi:hypothetical protein